MRWGRWLAGGEGEQAESRGEASGLCAARWNEHTNPNQGGDEKSEDEGNSDAKFDR